jgi:ubiquinone/menaquinone biosynthesis C-methylase UbiE
MLYHTIGKMAGVGQDSLLLDVCCGTGTIGLTLAKQVGPVSSSQGGGGGHVDFSAAATSVGGNVGG